jgi:ribose transport system substrate-binding protein
MLVDERLEQIVSFVDTEGFASVKELSRLLNVSEVTIRRDLQQLDEEKRLRRTYGGAASLQSTTLPAFVEQQIQPLPPPSEGFLIDRVDVLIAPSIDSHANRIVLGRSEQRNIPIIAESLGLPGAQTVVAVDNFQAGQALGRWVGHYARQHFEGQANVLDLTYYLENTLTRSHGFITGLKEILPAVQIVLSIDAQSTAQTAYQLTTDALLVYPAINIIFAINDATALGAIDACRDMNVNPASVLVIPFGLEGETLRNALLAGQYCKVGLAMFPEIIGPVCIEAAIKAYHRQPIPPRLITPYAILTSETLLDFYTQVGTNWQLNWETVKKHLDIPLNIHNGELKRSNNLPTRIGFIVPHTKHEWYRNLIRFMQLHLTDTQVGLETIDADQHLKDEVAQRKRSIAQMAAEQVRPGDVLLIEHGQINTYLAEELAAATPKNITVITNSISVFEILRNLSNITLILTGGLLPYSGDILLGPTAIGALKELRADKLFLAVTGISLDFGLSHTSLEEVAVKQAMIKAAREIILLADHTKFGQESVVQVARTNVVNKLITDNALPASTRLELTKLGIDIILAKT